MSKLALVNLRTVRSLDGLLFSVQETDYFICCIKNEQIGVSKAAACLYQSISSKSALLKGSSVLS
jgi:hypothetical protein